ncbi:MAG: hypothetical protein IJT15_01205 [Rickettsiales bacterium]|nr:hypothetical protein [Rickettsiales bacterium]
MENNDNSQKVSQDNLSKVNTTEQSKIVGRKEGEVLKSKGIADFQDQNGKTLVAKDIYLVAFSEDCASRKGEFKNYEKQQNKGDEDK